MNFPSFSFLPGSIVTFLFSDVEGSTRLWEQHPEAMRVALSRHDTLMWQAIAAHGGYIFKTMGDAVYAAFSTAAQALSAALAAQRAFQAESWGETPLRVRMALHTGPVEEHDSDYFGPPLYRATRLLGSGHGGQILLSTATEELVRDRLPANVSLRDLGEHRLKDLVQPERIFQVVVAGLPAQFPPLKTLDIYRHNLPEQLTRFIGREREIAEVHRLLSEHRLVTLIGPGGTGKTRLALQAAAELIELFPDGVRLVELASLTDPALVPKAIIAALELREPTDRPILNLLTAYLRAKELLFILDNCEHLIEACARIVANLLIACPKLKVLLTSRELLNVPGEALIRVLPLTLPNQRDLPPLETLSQYEAIQLFVDRARSVLPRFTLTETNVPAVVQICHRLDGIPLAIELAAARVQMLPVEQIATRLDDCFRLLVGGSRAALPRQQTLRALIDWSYDLLSEAERRLFHRLAVFVGGCSLEAAEAVCAAPLSGKGRPTIEPADVLDLLARLVNKSLVQVERANGVETRYRLLDTIHQYAKEKMIESGEESGLREEHTRYFLTFAEQGDRQLHGQGQLLWLEHFASEHDNLRAALTWSLASNPPTALRLAGHIWWFWVVQGYWSEGREWLKKVLAQNQDADPQLRAGVLSGIAWITRSFEESWEMAQQAMSLFQQTGDKWGEAFVLGTLGAVAGAQGNYDQRLAFFEKAMAIFREIGDKWGIRHILGMLGFTAMELKNYEKAASYQLEALTLAREIGDIDGLAWAHINLGEVFNCLGNYEQALAHYRSSLPLSHQVKNKWMVGMGLRGIGETARRRGDLDQARTAYRESLTLFTELSDPGHVLDLFLALAGLERNAEDVAGAERFIRENFPLLLESVPKSEIAGCLTWLAKLAGTRQRVIQAVRLLGAAQSLLDSAHLQRRPQDSGSFESILSTGRARLDEVEFARAWAEGQAMSVEELIEMVQSFSAQVD